MSHLIVRIICRLWIKLNVLHEYSKRRLFYTGILNLVRGGVDGREPGCRISPKWNAFEDNDHSGCENVLSGVTAAEVMGGSREKGKRGKEDYLINSNTNTSE